MIITRANTLPSTDADERPWYDLIDEVPEPPEDGMQQDDTITAVKSILSARYANDPSALVAGPSTNVIYDSRRPGSFVAPDCYVVFGVDTKSIRRDRRSYRIDEWGEIPAFVLEVASESTASRDLGEKREIYAAMGAREYWRFDVTGGEYYGEPLVGERLVNGEYERYELRTEANGDVWSRSEALGVDFYYRAEDETYGAFLLRDSATGEWLNLLSAERAARQAAEAQARAAEAQARAAETHNQELQAELDRLRRQQ